MSNPNIKLTGVPVLNGINAADFLKSPTPSRGIGSLDTTQVQGLLAQAAATANQAANTVSATTGIGKYGISAEQLEKTGYLKPGTVATYLKDPAQLANVIKSPSVWTGKDGALNLQQFTTNTDLQATALQNTLSSSFQSLSKLGALKDVTAPAELGSILQVASKFSVNDALAFAKGAAPADIAGKLQDVAKSAQFSINFTDTKLPAALKGQIPGANFIQQVNRAPVDQASAQILGSSRIPQPNYQNNPRPAPTSRVTASQVSAAVQQVLAAQRNYEQVLRQNGNNRQAPDVEIALEQLKNAQREAERLQEQYEKGTG